MGHNIYWRERIALSAPKRQLNYFCFTLKRIAMFPDTPPLSNPAGLHRVEVITRHLLKDTHELILVDRKTSYHASIKDAEAKAAEIQGSPLIEPDGYILHRVVKVHLSRARLPYDPRNLCHGGAGRTSSGGSGIKKKQRSPEVCDAVSSLV
jgi:hypothetical protein